MDTNNKELLINIGQLNNPRSKASVFSLLFFWYVIFKHKFSAYVVYLKKKLFEGG